jgi:hypothetical protein
VYDHPNYDLEGKLPQILAVGHGRPDGSRYIKKCDKNISPDFNIEHYSRTFYTNIEH